MPSEVELKFDAVCDEATFIAFLEALGNDRADEVEKEEANPSPPYCPGANGWENGSIEAFLEAAVAWANATKNGVEGYTKPDNPWKRCANIIYAGKFYE